MLKIRKIFSRNQNGFSLIELMVAVTILALVAMGLFQAFSAAFQSINDSKDRTIATNYAQQILEDYKNTHFEKIQPFFSVIEDTKFAQNVIVQKINANLKKVIVQIDWKDRNNKDKNINISTLINNEQSISEPGTIPAGIIIYADRYNLLPGNDEDAEPSHIYAEIVDKNGDIITDWNESNVSFDIESAIDLEGGNLDNSYLGVLRNFSVSPSNGVAETYFDQHAAEEREGFIKIKASIAVDGVGEIYDTLTLKVSNGAVSVILTADKTIISTESEEEGIAHLTATIVDAGERIVDTIRIINFNIVSGPGSLENFVTTNEGVAYIDLVSGTTTGIATITATSNLLEPDSIDIQIVDPDLNKIEVEADSQTIIQKGSTDITATLTDYLGKPVSTETINFTMDNNALGYFSNESITTDANGEAVTTLTMNYAGTITVTASWTADEDTDVTDTVQILCKNHHLYVWADPLTINEGNSTTISAELTDAAGNYIEGEIINFIILDGSGNFNNNSDTTDENGIASATLAIATPGNTIVQANWQDDPTVVFGEVEVECTSAPIYQVALTAEKTTISVGETLGITATVTEQNEIPDSNLEVVFSLDDYSNARLDNQNSSVTTTTDDSGIASVNLSGLAAGESVTVSVEAGGDSDNITISCEVPEIKIELNEDYTPKHGSGHGQGDKQVYFSINVLNSSIDLEKMIIYWESTENDNEKLSELWIDDTQVYYNNSGAVNGTVITFNLYNPFTLQEDVSYEIKMIFKNDVVNKDWTISFFNPVTQEVLLPLITFELN